MDLVKIYCLSENESLFENLNVHDDIILRTERLPPDCNAVKFIAHEPVLENMDFLILDLTTTDTTESDVISIASFLKNFLNTQLIVIATKSAETDMLFAKLCEIGIKRCIAVDEQCPDFSESVLKTISTEQRFEDSRNFIQNGLLEEARKIVSPELIIPKGRKIIVAVGGAMGRIGSTTHTFGIYRYLKFLGFTPLIVDSKQVLIETFCNLYSEETEPFDNYIKIKDYCFASDLQTDKFNAFILHLGTVCDKNRGSFKQSDIHILVGGAKDWELQNTAETAVSQDLLDEDLLLILSFCKPEQAQTIGSTINVKSFAAPYMPDIFAENVGENDFYRDMIKARIERVLLEKKS